MNKTLNLLLTIALIALAGVSAMAQSKTNGTSASVGCGKAVALVESDGKRFGLKFDENALGEDYKSYVELERKRRSRKIQTAEEYRKFIETEALKTLTTILPEGGQPQNLTITIERWTDKDGHKHTKITFS